MDASYSNSRVLVVVLGACLPLARADDIPWGLNPNLNDKIFIGLGAFYAAKPSTTAQLNSQTPRRGHCRRFPEHAGYVRHGVGP